ncbi:hypothetical protein KR018_007964 [Drosophila ironensis]|nr:hypothetical protein KR018_007964 [Drosophila ironensis]
MSEVFTQCQQLFHSKPISASAFGWWLDKVAPVYKEQVQSMTINDCQKLKRQLAREVEDSDSDDQLDLLSMCEISGAILVVMVIIVLLILLGRMRWRQEIKEIDAIIEDYQQNQQKCEEPPPEVLPMPKKKKKSVKRWLRRHCRPVFLHSNAKEDRDRERMARKEAVHHELTEERIDLWNQAREEKLSERGEK